MRTISSPSDVDRLFRQGSRASHRLILVLAAASEQGRDPGGRVLFVAGRKLGGAVVRNRCKRVLRESCRRLGGPWPGLDVALVARMDTARATPLELDAAASECLRRTGVTTP